MRASLTALLGIMCLVLFTGCAPKFQVAVPDGWTVAKELNNEQIQAKLIVNEKEEVAIKVFCLPAGKVTVEDQTNQLLDSLKQAGAEVVEQVIAPDKSSARVVFKDDDPQAKVAGRFVAKTSSRQGRVLVIFGYWPADKDAVAAPAFDQIAKSADFK